MNFLKYNIPNIITISNIIISLFVIIIEIYEFIFFVYLINCCLDYFDGMIARYLNVESKTGKILDNISDFLSFGMIPAFYINHDVLSLLLATCVLLRLIHFYKKNDNSFFYGLPSSLSAGLIYLFPTTEAILILSFLNISFFIKIPSFKKLNLETNINA